MSVHWKVWSHTVHYMHSVLGQGSFCMNDYISVVWHEASQPVALRKCSFLKSRLRIESCYLQSCLHLIQSSRVQCTDSRLQELDGVLSKDIHSHVCLNWTKCVVASTTDKNLLLLLKNETVFCSLPVTERDQQLHKQNNFSPSNWLLVHQHSKVPTI